jgi:hypothetical protein
MVGRLARTAGAQGSILGNAEQNKAARGMASPVIHSFSAELQPPGCYFFQDTFADSGLLKPPSMHQSIFHWQDNNTRQKGDSSLRKNSQHQRDEQKWSFISRQSVTDGSNFTECFNCFFCVCFSKSDIREWELNLTLHFKLQNTQMIDASEVDQAIANLLFPKQQSLHLPVNTPNAVPSSPIIKAQT